MGTFVGSHGWDNWVRDGGEMGRWGGGVEVEDRAVYCRQRGNARQ